MKVISKPRWKGKRRSSRSYLGTCDIHGRSITFRRFQKAYIWINAAAEKKLEIALKWRDTIRGELPPAEKSKAEKAAKELLEKLADDKKWKEGHSEAPRSP